MSCPCIQSNPVPTCIDTLTVGTIGKINTPVIVFITSIATGRIELFETLSDDTGLVVIDTRQFDINDQANYKVEIFTVSNPQGPAETITVNDVSDVCIYFTGQKVDGYEFTDFSLSTESNETPPSPRNPIYHYTEVDYSVPEYIQTVGVGTLNNVVHIVLGNPNIYKKGKVMTVKDEQGNASVNNIFIDGQFDQGNPQTILADKGALSFYSNGLDAFFITSDI
jgi:hypothetical protein